ncbi:MAG: carboxypeptidase regulatory-like domain-containing protein [Chloracidobacterium sp.]|nr:carboxypeptidase regulatory-like domain-containing protein [Chloracidobacterium sp.]
MLQQITRALYLLGALVLGASLAMAQARSSSADLTGTVSDPSKSPIRGASVTATNIATGLARNGATGANGVYRIPLLPPGEYEVKIEINSFKTQIKKGVTLTVGQILTLNFELSNEGVLDSASIETEQPLIETERTHQSSTITQRPINELPINGRNFLDFARLTPGVVEESPAITGVQIGAFTTSGLSFAGQNGRANSVQIDGVDNNDIASNGVRPTISQEAVREFQINRNGYNAEFGRVGGGVINIVSKSGANEFHGNVYEFFRNERLDARNVFAKAMAQDPPLKRNQPGFTFGGPIKRDRTFFFTAYEGLIRRESAFTTILSDPSILQPTSGQQDLITTLIGSGSPNLVAQGQQLQAMLTTAPNSPISANRNTYNLLASSTGAFPLTQTSSTGSIRLDHSLNEQDFLFLRASLTNDSQHNSLVGGLQAPSTGFDIGNRDNTFVLGETHVFRGGSSNEFRFQNIRNTYNVDTVDPFGPRILIGGVGVFGRDFSSPSDRTQRSIQFVDNFSLSRGRNNIKFGVEYSHYAFETNSPVFLGGIIDFEQLPIPLGQALGSDAATQLVRALSTPRARGGLGRPDLAPVVTTQPLTTIQQVNFGFMNSISQGFGKPIAQTNGGILGLYLQDGFKARSNLYLSLGLRYDYDLQPSVMPRDGNNVGPRLSFAYDPFNNGRTVVRGGGGVYYQSLFTGLAFIPSVLTNGGISTLLVTADPRLTPISPTSPCGQALATTGLPPSFCFYQQLVAQGLLTAPSTGIIPESAYSSLLGLTRATNSNRLLIGLAPDLVNGYSAQASLGVDHQFGRDWNVSINYLFNRGVKLIRPRQVNALPDPSRLDAFGRPALDGRADPTLLANQLFESAGNSTYHGMAVSVNKRFGRHYQVIGSYTFSKTIADAADINFEQGPQDPTNVRADRGLSSFDLRHRLSIAAIFESPFSGGSGNPWYERALADFYLAPIITTRSGFPFDIRTGIDINLDTTNNDRPFAVGRNTGVGPWFSTTDLRVGRRIRFGADNPVGIELIFDAFNLFNRTNFKDVNGVTNGALFLSQLGFTSVRVEGSSNIPASQFSGFTSAYDPRVIQIGAKFNF